jgi:hypothetical protein
VKYLRNAVVVDVARATSVAESTQTGRIAERTHLTAGDLRCKMHFVRHDFKTNDCLAVAKSSHFIVNEAEFGDGVPRRDRCAGRTRIRSHTFLTRTLPDIQIEK